MLTFITEPSTSLPGEIVSEKYVKCGICALFLPYQSWQMCFLIDFQIIYGFIGQSETGE